MASGFSHERPRAQNWIEEEKQALSHTYAARFMDIDGSLRPTMTNIDKQRLWNEVVAAVNACSKTPRTSKQIDEKLKGMRRTTKKIESGNQSEILKTGGRADIVELDESQQVLLQTIPKTSISGIPGGFDASIKDCFLAGQCTPKFVLNSTKRQAESSDYMSFEASTSTASTVNNPQILTPPENGSCSDDFLPNEEFASARPKRDLRSATEVLRKLTLKPRSWIFRRNYWK